ncbi:hypothetical protein pb186bvf_012639 [Paramecium bursaria]
MFPKVLKPKYKNNNPVWHLLNKQCYDLTIELRDYLLSGYLLKQFSILKITDYHENTLALHNGFQTYLTKRNEKSSSANKNCDQFLFACQTCLFSEFSNKSNDEYPPDAFTDYFIENYSNRLSIIEDNYTILENDFQTQLQNEVWPNVENFVRKFVFLNKFDKQSLNVQKYFKYVYAHRNYLKSLKLDEIMQYKIYWALQCDLQIKCQELLKGYQIKGKMDLELQIKNQHHYGKIDKYLDRLPYPKYYYVIAANVGIYGLWQIRGMEVIYIAILMFMLKHFTHNPVNIREGRLLTLITYAFSHQQFLHLAFNIVSLYFFGRVIEGSFGSKRFLGIYLVGALAGSLLGNRHWLLFQVLLHQQIRYQHISFVIFHQKSSFYSYSLYQHGFYSSQGDNSNISHESHLAGILTGVGYYFLTRGK